MAAAGLWLSTAVPAHAVADNPDQSQLFASGAETKATPMAQTFTAGTTAAIDRISLMVNTAPGATSITVQLQTVAGGMPSGTVLGSSTFAGSVPCCRQWHDFAFSPAVSIAQGTQYAIVVVPNANLGWYADFSGDAYGSGQLWLASGSTWITGALYGYDFCFQTFVTEAPANSAPVVAANSAAVAVDEGSPITNTGTFSDPDGDTVTLTASSGTLTKSGTSSGTWSWSAPAADEAPAQAVTVTADDGNGLTSNVSFTYTVSAVAPTVSITGAPAGGPEGTAITLTGSATSPDAADNAAGFSLTWTLTKDGNPFANATGPTLTFTPDDEGTFVASLAAADDGGNSATSSVTIAGLNVTPSVKIAGVTHAGAVLVANQAVTISAGFTDPGALDTHSATLDYGDGSPSDSYLLAPSAAADVTETHLYARPGTYTVTYTVADDDGGTSVDSVKVTIETPAEALAALYAYVQTLPLDKGEKRGLSNILERGMKAAARGETRQTCHSVDEFLMWVTVLTRGHRLSAADSANMTAAAWAIHKALGCRKVRVGWFDLDA